MTIWEYLVVSLGQKRGGTLTPEEEQNELNSLGSQGWELVNVSQRISGMRGQYIRAYFKRPKQT